MKIILVEDTAAIGRWLSLALKGQHHDVVWRRDAAEAREHLAHGAVDLLIVEHQLPDGTGEALGRELQQDNPAMGVLLIFPVGFDVATAPPSYPYLVRPFSQDELARAVAAAVAVDGRPASAADTMATAGSDEPNELDLGVRAEAVLPVAAPTVETAEQPPFRGPAGETVSRLEGGLPEAIAALYHRKARGVLHISNELYRRTVTFIDGSPTFVRENYSSDNFGRFLVRREVIDEQTLEQSHDLMAAKGVPQGEALVAIGVLTSERLFLLLRAFQRERLLAMFAWPAPELRFDPAAEIPEGQPRYRMDAVDLIFEGFKRFGTADELYLWLETNGDRFVQRSPVFAPLLPRLMSALPRLPVAELTRGDRPLRLSLRESGAELIYGIRALRAMLMLGMIQAVDTPQPFEALREEDISPLERASALSAAPRASSPQAAEALEQIYRTYLSMQFTDFYALLGVSAHAELEEIELALEETRRRYDKLGRACADNEEAQEKIQEILAHISLGVRRLLDNVARIQYDTDLAERSAQRPDRRNNIGAEVRFRTGLAALRASRPGVAQAEFEAACAQRPNDPLCTMYASWAAYLQRQAVAKEITAFRQSIEDSARYLGDAEGYAFMAQILMDLGFREQARIAVQHSLQLDNACALARSLDRALQAQSQDPAEAPAREDDAP